MDSKEKYLTNSSMGFYDISTASTAITKDTKHLLPICSQQVHYAAIQIFFTGLI